MNKRKANALRRSFGQRVRSLRVTAGLSQMELSGKAELDHTYIGGVERGERNLSLEAIGKLAKGLKVDPVELFNYTTEGAADPALHEIVALLEREDRQTRDLALRLVRTLVRSE
jgi:transcriptional regulator with XRE-family HTH domain